jgi:hypothetical protein
MLDAWAQDLDFDPARRTRYAIVLAEIVLRNRLLQGKVVTNPDPPVPTGDAQAIERANMGYSFTYLGVAFLKACRGPALPPIFQSKGCFGNE